ncbi:hypothetical protein ES702_03160 [subsurface metagenome]
MSNEMRSRSQSGAKAKSKKIKSKKEKKGFLRDVLRGKIYVQSTFNNTIVTLTDEQGNTIDWVSAGVLGFKGTKKSTPYTATLVGRAMADKVLRVGIKELRILVSGVGPGRDSAVRAIAAKGLNISSIVDITSIPHNGCRAKKPRRV